MTARRFLAPRGRAGDGRGYLARPLREVEPSVTWETEPDVVARIAEATSMSDEPECVSGAISDRWGEDARHHERVRHSDIVAKAQETRRLLSLEDRLRDAKARAKAQHRRDLRGEFLAVEKLLERARRAAPATLMVRHDGFLVAAIQTDHDPPAAVARIARIEERLDRVPDAL